MEPHTRTDFTLLAATALVKLLPPLSQVTPVADDGEIYVVLPDGGKATIEIGNYYRNYLADKNFEAQVEAMAALVQDTFCADVRALEDWNVARGVVLPMFLKANVASDPDHPLATGVDWPLPALSIIYSVPARGLCTLIPQAAPAAWGVTVETLHEQAVANLRARPLEREGLELVEVPGVKDAGVLVYQSSDGYAAARALAIDTLLQELPASHERIAVAMPNRDCLILATPHLQLAPFYLGRAVEQWQRGYALTLDMLWYIPAEHRFVPWERQPAAGLASARASGVKRGKRKRH